MSAPRQDSLTSLPNLLTIGRVVLIPVIGALLVFPSPVNLWIALALYVLAAVTDWLDGWLARRSGILSPFGTMLDPIADKLLVGLLLLVLAWNRMLDALDLIPAMAILFREIFISGLREFLGAAKVKLPVTMLAKYKTTTQLIAVGLIIAAGLFPALVLPAKALLWVAALLTVWTGWQYLKASTPHLIAPS